MLLLPLQANHSQLQTGGPGGQSVYLLLLVGQPCMARLPVQHLLGCKGALKT